MRNWQIIVFTQDGMMVCVCQETHQRVHFSTQTLSLIEIIHEVIERCKLMCTLRRHLSFAVYVYTRGEYNNN